VFDYITSVAKKKELQDNQKLISMQVDEKRYYFNITVTIVSEKNGSIDHIVVLYQNVTELKELENLKSDFIATVSHEFKTPLMSLIMGASLMMEENLGTLNKEQSEVMEAIKEDGEKLSDLVNNLFQISKLESSNAVFKIEPCSIIEIIETSYRRFLKAAEKMCISVSDTGVGISEEYIDKIFIKFFSVDTYGNNKKGTGLGLSICKEIVEAHSGEIWCESQIDLGSTFTFTIPIAK
jgi:signal transduction histidine kinase